MLMTMARQWVVNWVNANYYFADVLLPGKVNSFKGVRRKYIGSRVQIWPRTMDS
jgi:hypothetical protein